MTTAQFEFSSGPRNAKIALVGEGWGDQEALVGAPFVGSGGQELTKLLREAGIDRKDCFLTNVLPLRIPQSNMDLLCDSKAAVGKTYPLRPLKQGKYLRWEFLPEIARLQAELEEVRPNLVVALGNTACWALLGSAGISSLRGTISPCQLVDGVKVLPTYHPNAVLRSWALRPIVVADLMKADRERGHPEIIRPERQVTVSPTIAEIIEWASRPATHYAVDIETRARQITEIAFARSKSDALVIPFWDLTRPGNHYWPSPLDEILAWKLVGDLLARPIPKIFQNGMYDLRYLLGMGFKVWNCTEDTMLMHHSMYPELQKGLGFLGSIYCNEAAWKLMNRHRSDEPVKKDE
jgi:uracil-DNA glycosylase